MVKLSNVYKVRLYASERATDITSKFQSLIYNPDFDAILKFVNHNNLFFTIAPSRKFDFYDIYILMSKKMYHIEDDKNFIMQNIIKTFELNKIREKEYILRRSDENNLNVYVLSYMVGTSTKNESNESDDENKIVFDIEVEEKEYYTKNNQKEQKEKKEDTPIEKRRRGRPKKNAKDYK